MIVQHIPVLWWEDTGRMLITCISGHQGRCTYCICTPTSASKGSMLFSLFFKSTSIDDDNVSYLSLNCCENKSRIKKNKNWVLNHYKQLSNLIIHLIWSWCSEFHIPVWPLRKLKQNKHEKGLQVQVDKTLEAIQHSPDSIPSPSSKEDCLPKNCGQGSQSLYQNWSN